MPPLWVSLCLAAATLTTGLTAGLFLVFAHSVMPGLSTLADTAYLTAFQRIDAAIANPWMGLSFVGSPVLTAVALVGQLGSPSVAVPLAVALALVVTGVVITGVVHLPINARAQAAAPGFEGAEALRAQFEDRWVPWNVVRTATAALAVLALAWALLAAGAGA